MLLLNAVAILSPATGQPHTPTLETRDNSLPDVTAAMILSIAPKSASCPTPAGQCMTAQQVADTNIVYIANAFGIHSKGEVAAALGTMAFESGQFQYNHNMYPPPGRPGQGTRNMQMAAFNLKYAATLAQMDSGFAAKAANIPSTDAGEAHLQLINTYPIADVGSAFWFINSTCTPAQKQGLQAGTVEGWKDYVTSCIQTTWTQDRQDLWSAACKALGGCS